MSQYNTIRHYTQDCATYIFTRAELLTLSLRDIQQIALKKQATVFGDKRKKENWIAAILEAQIVDERDRATEEKVAELEQSKAPISEPEQAVTQCSECPFARAWGIDYQGNTRFICSAWGKHDPHGRVIKGDTKPQAQCFEELRRARDKRDGYENHFINDRTERDNRSRRNQVSSANLAWFANWQTQSLWAWERRYHEMTQEVEEYLQVQSELIACQPWLEQQQLQAVFDGNRDITIYKGGVMFVRVTAVLPFFVASSPRGIDVVEAEDMQSAIAPFLEKEAEIKKLVAAFS